MSNYLVTGGAGFVGSYLTRHLLELGESVRVLDNFTTGNRENLAEVEGRFDLVEGDMCDPDTAKAAMDGMDYVLHQAAIPSVPRSVDQPIETTENNIMGTVNLLEAARLAKVRKFVYAASSSAYGDQAAQVKVETMPTRPLSPYAAAKLAGEQFCQAYFRCFGLETVCLRYFNVFGPRQDPNSPYSAVIPLFIRAALESKRPKVHGDGTQSRDFTYIENVARANLLAARGDKGMGETVNIACGQSFTLLDLLSQVAEMTGAKIDPEFTPPRAGDVKHSLASIDKARDLLGYEVVVDFEEGLRRTVDYYRSL